MSYLTTPSGNYFEDFQLGQIFHHGVPRTITNADATLYLALTGSRFALHCATTVAQDCGFKDIPLDNFLVFHIAFGKTVNDISLNAVANLGYAEIQFYSPCYAGDTLSVTSEVIGLKQNSNGKTGIVYVHSIAHNQKNQKILSWIRWVMVEKKQTGMLDTINTIPEYQKQINHPHLSFSDNIDFSHWKDDYSDNQFRFSDIEVGNQIFHRDGLTINDSDHSLATRLYQNNAKVHFNQHLMQDSEKNKRLVYGGHIISLCRALSYNGLGNTLWLIAINSGTHSNPCHAGDTIYCQSEILDKKIITGRNDVALVRLRMTGIKNNTPEKMEYLFRTENNKLKYHSDLVLDLDFWCLMLT